MFDVVTSNLLRSAPGLPGLNSDEIPARLTRHYIELVSERLKGDKKTVFSSEEKWSLEHIADAYEILASIEKNAALRRAAAFVSGTAQLIIARKQGTEPATPTIQVLGRDGVAPQITAALLFLIAEQYADANEAGMAIQENNEFYEIKILGEHIRDLVKGQLESILRRADRWRSDRGSTGSIQHRALKALASTLSEGIELLASNIMLVHAPESTPRRFTTPQEAFRHVIEAASNLEGAFTQHLGGELITQYAGPAHMAALLLSVSDTITEAALTKLPSPNGADVDFWNRWLRSRSKETPFVWPNHREAIAKGFYQTGQSAVLVLPTGAGKTTVSALKIAGVLAQGKKVIFLAPTHALVEQLTEDIQKIFPKNEFGLAVSNDFDALLLDDAQLQDIEVMTPERCLAMLSFSASSFQNVGLLVFDECHLLSPQSGKIGRALDGMLCLLTFAKIVSNADMLFMSAMLKNGQEFARWIESITIRPCIAVDLLWKPSRQARGVVVYEDTEIKAAIQRARQTQLNLDTIKGSTARTLRVAAKNELIATPHVIWGLQHNWLTCENSISLTDVVSNKVLLGSGYKNGDIWVTPNANEIATKIAILGTATRLKTIVFVNKKVDAISVAQKIATELGQNVRLSDSERELWSALSLELGDTKHSVLCQETLGAVPHNAAMLRLERALSERLFRRQDGAQVIVATPTLAQGLNLPAQLAVLAGDKRAGTEQGERETLESHELLNAAARAGRAGHLANGIVILIPEPVIRFTGVADISEKLKTKLASILPEDDRCVTISDPLEVVLDRVMSGELNDKEVRYTVNRLASLGIRDDTRLSQDNIINRSFGAFLAKNGANEQSYQLKVTTLWGKVIEAAHGEWNPSVVLIASQSGLPLDLLERLRSRLNVAVGTLPITVVDWIEWACCWLCEDTLSRDHLLDGDVRRSALAAAGQSTSSELTISTIRTILPGIKNWVLGLPFNEIERSLGGNPDAETGITCPRGRELVSTFIPRGLSYIMGVVTRMAEEIDIFSVQPNLNKLEIQSLASAVRKGFDSIHKLEFANEHNEILSRVQAHKQYQEYLSTMFSPIDLPE